MSTFVPVHDSIWTHRKTLLLAAELDLPPTTVVCHMIRLWQWAIENAGDGMIGHLPGYVLAAAAQYGGDPKRFLVALHAAGYVDSDGGLHNWADRNGRLLQKRIEKRDYMRRRRAEEGLRTDEAPEPEPAAGDESDAAAPAPDLRTVSAHGSRVDHRTPTHEAGSDHSVSTETPRAVHVVATGPPRGAEQYTTEHHRTEQESTAGEPVVFVAPSARASARMWAGDDEDDDRPVYESEMLALVEAEYSHNLEHLQGPLPCRDRDDLILLARIIWTYPLVDLIHEAQRLRARYKRAPVSWPCAFDDWLREGRSVRFLDGRIDAARHGTRDYLPDEGYEEEEWATELETEVDGVSVDTEGEDLIEGET